MDSSNNDKRTMSEAIEQFWLDAEKSAEEAVKRALARLRVPRHAELKALHDRLDGLERRIEALNR